MKQGLMGAALAAAMAFGLASGARAEYVLYDNKPFYNQFDAQISFGVSPFGSSIHFVATQFSLSQSYYVSGVGYYTIDRDSTPTNYEILSSDGGLPGSILAYGSTSLTAAFAAGAVYPNQPYYKQRGEIAPIYLASGSYFLALEPDPNNYGGLAGAFGSPAYVSSGFGSAFSPVPLRFPAGLGVIIYGSTVISTIPIPPAAPLFGVALIVLGALGYARRRISTRSHQTV